MYTSELYRSAFDANLIHFDDEENGEVCMFTYNLFWLHFFQSLLFEIGFLFFIFSAFLVYMMGFCCG